MLGGKFYLAASSKDGRWWKKWGNERDLKLKQEGCCFMVAWIHLTMGCREERWLFAPAQVVIGSFAKLFQHTRLAENEPWQREQFSACLAYWNGSAKGLSSGERLRKGPGVNSQGQYDNCTHLLGWCKLQSNHCLRLLVTLFL